MIKVENLSKVFMVKERESLFKVHKRKVEAVKNVSLEIEEGKIVGLLGINGAGKTTTIKMLTTLLSPTSGSYYLDEIDAIKNPMIVKNRINMVAGGERMIYWRLTAYENLWYYGQIYGIENKLLKKRIDKLLDIVGLSEKANVPVETFSKGMKQRLQIARGLINDPQYLFMDEPTIGLDAVVAKELREHVRNLAKKEHKGILLTSHYLEEIEELCDYIYILNKGQLIKQGTVEELARDTFSQRNYILSFYESYVGIEEKMGTYLRQYDESVVVEKQDSQMKITCTHNISKGLSEICAKEGLLIKEMYEQKPNLEDTILKIAKEA